MGRKSLAPQRRSEIVDAFEAAVAEHGIGVSLEEVARRAGVKRQLITHYFGDRSRLTDALKQRVAERCRAWLSGMVEDTGDGNREIALARALLLPSDEDSGALELTWRVVNALWDAGLMGDLHREFQTSVAAELAKEHPQARRSACDAVAYGLLALWIGHGDLVDNGFRSPDPEAAYRCALVLLESLNDGRPRHGGPLSRAPK